MADRFDQDADYAQLEARRIAFAAARIAEHANRELVLLTRATEAESDRVARELESAAHTAYQDFLALIEEHGLAN
jgi:hypothetical protein